MLWPGIKKLGKELQLKRTNREAVGMVRNCFIKLFDGQNMKVLELFVPEINDSDKEYITEKLKINKVKKYEWPENGVRVIFNEYFLPYSINKIKAILTDFAEYFSLKYPNQKLHCQKCGIPKDLEVCCIDAISLAVCEDCYKSFENEINDRNLENKYAPTNYLAGFLGSLLFSIPGILVTILLFVFLNTLAAVSSVLYVILGIKGYKKFNGKVSRSGVIIIILSTIIMVGLGIVISYSVFIFKELKTIDFDMLFYILRMPEVQREILQNMALSYVISGFYLIVQMIQLMKEWKTEKVVQKAEDI
jgi:hypothetical protein